MPNAPMTLSDMHFNFSAEYIIWARRLKSVTHYFNNEQMTQLNRGKRMSNVWSIPTVEACEKHFGKHLAQKPLKLLYRSIIANTKQGDWILDPFAGSCTTGIAANLLKRNSIGINQDTRYLDIGVKRKEEIANPTVVAKMLVKMSICGNEPMVMVNHAKSGLRELMIEKGICYLRAGDTKGSLLVKPGFERLQYVLLHINGEHAQMFRLKTKGHFQIWMQETLEKYSFNPKHTPYYIVLLFNPNKQVKISTAIDLKASYTYVAKIKALNEFVEI